MAPSGESNVTLFTHTASPYAQRVQFALAEKGIPFKAVYVDLTDKPKELLEANPIYGKVPTLVHDGNSICESLIILEYLEEAWPETKPLLPKDAVAKSKARFWADFLYKGFLSIQKILLAKPDTPERELAVAELQKFANSTEKILNEYSAEGPFVTGDKVSYLDVILVPLASWNTILTNYLQAPLPSPDQVPRLHKWLKAIKEHKAYKEGVRPDEEVIDYFKLMKKRAEAAAAAAAAATNGK